MNWFISIVKTAGVMFPVSAVFVQAASELEASIIEDRIKKLEDPISFLHKDIQKISKEFYKSVSADKTSNIPLAILHFDENFYIKYSKPLAALEAQGFIRGIHAIDSKYVGGIELSDPTYIMYLCALSEEKSKMKKLIKIMEECEVGKWLDGKKIKSEIDLPLPVIKAVFQIYESKGYGILSKEVGMARYLTKV